MLVKADLNELVGGSKGIHLCALYSLCKTDQFKFQLAVSRAQHINVPFQRFNMTPDMIFDT